MDKIVISSSAKVISGRGEGDSSKRSINPANLEDASALDNIKDLVNLAIYLQHTVKKR